jgi:hypothetical protein
MCCAVVTVSAAVSSSTVKLMRSIVASPVVAVTASAAVRIRHHVHRITHTWKLALAPAVIPIPRASRSASIRDFAAAADLEFIADQFALPSIRNVQVTAKESHEDLLPARH